MSPLDHEWEIFDKYDIDTIHPDKDYKDYQCSNCGAIKSKSINKDRDTYNIDTNTYNIDTAYMIDPHNNNWETEIPPCSEILLKNVME